MSAPTYVGVASSWCSGALLRARGLSRSLFVVLASCALWLASGAVFCAEAQAAAAAERAAEADVPAAMCDPMGASVAVPPDMDLPLLDRGRFEQLPCEALASILRSHVRKAPRAEHAVTGDPERPEPPASEAERTRNDVARTSSATLPALSEPMSLDLSQAMGLSPRSGHHRAVYRPPLSSRRA